MNCKKKFQEKIKNITYSWKIPNLFLNFKEELINSQGIIKNFKFLN
jgi:hypothetical protein